MFMKSPNNSTLGVIGFLVLLICSIQSNAQSFKGALVGGATTSQIGGDDLSGFNKWGFFAGPSVSYPLNDELDLTAQILYTRKGSKASNEELRKNKGLWEKMTMVYFELPLFVEYKVQERLFLQGGIAPEYRLSAETRTYGQVDGDFRTFSLNGLAGVRYQLSDRFSAFSRLSVSLIPIDKGEISFNPARSRPNAPSDFRNRVAHLMIKFGLRYSLGKL